MKYHRRTAVQVLLIGVILAAAFVQPAEAARWTRKVQLEADHELVGIMQVRDRGDVLEALVQVTELIRKHPNFVPAHRLYQEIAVMARRNGGFVEAEYRHYLEEDPEDPRRNLLHASAALSAVVADPGRLDREVLRDIERKIALAEGDPKSRSQALLLSADIARWAGDSERLERQLRAAVGADKRSVTARSELVRHLSLDKRWEEATEVCLGLLADAPWRLPACIHLVPKKAGAPAPSQDDQDRLVARIERLEKRRSGDAVTLQSLERFYAAVGERRGAEALRERLQDLDPSWKAPVSRNPYVEPLPGGELEDSAIAFIERLATIREATESDPQARARAFRDLESLVPPEDPRMKAYLQREIAFTLRDPTIMDREGSRAAIALALEATPDDPSVMNEWAYMSAVDGVELEEALAKIDAALELVLGRPFQPTNIDVGEEFEDFEIELGESIGAFIDTRGWVLYQSGRYAEALEDLQLASLMTADGTVQSHLGRTRHKLGNERGAFHHLVRALALGTEDEEEVRALAEELYLADHAVPGGLDALVEELRRQLLRSGLDELADFPF